MIGIKNRRGLVLIPLLIFVLLTSVIATISIGSADVPINKVYRVLWDIILNDGQGVKNGLCSTAHYHIIWDIRLPRVIIGILCGAGLATCGAVMQALVLNPIADPYVLGVSSGASAGAAWALLMPLPYFVGQHQVTVTAMLGAMIASFFVYTMAKIGSGGKLKPVTLILSGTAINAVMSAITSLLIFMAKSHESISAVYNWQMGSIASAQWSTLPLPAIGVIFSIIVFIRYGVKFNLMMMGDDDAIALGMNVKFFRTIMMALVAVVVATLVSVTGIIGFVGLMIPHIVRLIAKTSDNSSIILLSAIVGAIFLIWADAGARGFFGAAELPLGIITAFIGAPFFLYLMAKKSYGGKME
ncbi:FecCD family ABC transporter permease [Clostridium uliginosum]|uniref:Iron complex transport system permease protein n=1 Tax=Clostridium uliginosum TaxID=119641 RepID=A0A1I1PHQ6_9CLOT|nr:iron ABC transporter permease [Clostridium uliginosum]SFD09384.1 iron complex transport system permease protein [Clostridium uliginosum]